MSVCRNYYHALPWEYSGRDPAVWRHVYRWLESLMSEVNEVLDREEQANAPGPEDEDDEKPSPFKKKNPFKR